jgi:uncharacterized protein with GYD domain
LSERDDLRVARTEALFRDVNERIAESAARFGSEDAAFVCECDDPSCTDRIATTIEAYDEVRTDAAQFIVADDHVNDEVERVVERTADFTLVEKVKPLVRATVVQLNPRAA